MSGFFLLLIFGFIILFDSIKKAKRNSNSYIQAKKNGEETYSQFDGFRYETETGRKCRYDTDRNGHWCLVEPVTSNVIRDLTLEKIIDGNKKREAKAREENKRFWLIASPVLMKDKKRGIPCYGYYDNETDNIYMPLKDNSKILSKQNKEYFMTGKGSMIVDDLFAKDTFIDLRDEKTCDKPWRDFVAEITCVRHI